MMRHRLLALSALPLLALAACNPGPPPAPPLPPLSKAAPLDTADASFVQTLNEADLVDIALGNLAATHAGRNDLRALAATVVKDHTDDRTALGKLVSPHDITLTASPMREDQEMIDRLGKLYGARFDSAFLTHIKSGHASLDRSLVQEIATTKDDDLKSLAGSAQKMIAGHVATAEAIAPTRRTARHRHR